MAEIDTGLGWAANDAWLVSAADAVIGSLSVMGGSSFPGQPVGRAATINDMAAVALPYQNVNNSWWTYIANDTNSPGDMVVFYYLDGNFKTWVFVSDASPITYHKANKDVGSNNWWGWDTFTTAGTFDASTGLYYTSTSTGGNSTNIPPVPEFSSLRAGLDAIQVVHSDFTKPNAGFAVACVAKWKTHANVVISTPILISSVSAYTEMADSSSTYNEAKLNILRQGMRFYMSFFDITDAVPVTTMPVLDLTGSEQNPRTLEQVFATIADLDHAAILVLDSPDPYGEEGGGGEEEGGGGEELDDDPVEEETLPLPSVAGHGFCTIYVPSSQELGQMASYLWSGSFDVSQVLKLFSNPMDSILGLSAVPVSLSGSPEQIYLGGVALTGITMPKYTGRTSVKVDFGTVTVGERWGSYLDYAPYTDFSIYLPFIGIKPIKADDIMGKTISLMYAIDILSGGCVAYLRPMGGSVLYEWSGQCAVQIPVTGRSYDNVFQSAMSVATATLAAVAAPASAPVLSGAVASAAVQAAATKPHIERSGTVNGITGFLGQLRPYLIRTIPEAFIPADQNKFIGYPAYINVDLSSVVGYNEVDSIHLENVTATGAELDEIETILKGGVIF